MSSPYQSNLKRAWTRVDYIVYSEALVYCKGECSISGLFEEEFCNLVGRCKLYSTLPHVKHLGEQGYICFSRLLVAILFPVIPLGVPLANFALNRLLNILLLHL